MFFSRVKQLMNSEEMCGGLTDYTRQRLLMLKTLCQLMTKCLFVNFPRFFVVVVVVVVFCCCCCFCTERCSEETTLQLHKVAHKTCM